MNIIQQLKERWKGRKERNFLGSHGCISWREYERKYDPDVGYMARWAHSFYHGYDYIFPLESRGIVDLEFSPRAYHTLVDQMTEWCEKNCAGKWRNDWHRGFWDHQGNFEFNGIGGTDLMFFAFKESKDFVAFRLVWE